MPIVWYNHPAIVIVSSPPLCAPRAVTMAISRHRHRGGGVLNVKKSIEERFWAKVNKTGTCWLWTGTKGAEGYGKFWANGGMRGASRVSYELSIGPIQSGMTIDHVLARGCTNVSCVNPSHLEQVTMSENLARSSGPASINRRKTACIKGHEFDEANTRVSRDGFRHCRKCQKYRLHARRLAIRAALSTAKGEGAT